MGVKHDRLQIIVSWLKAGNEGALCAEIAAATGMCTVRVHQAFEIGLKDGSIHRAGPLHYRRYYTSAAMAAQAHDRLMAEHRERSRKAKLDKRRRHNEARVRRRAEERAAAGLPPIVPRRTKGEPIVKAAPKPNPFTRYKLLAAEVLRRADNPDGFACSDVSFDGMTFDAKAVGNQIRRLQELEPPLLFRGRVSHKIVRYFRSKQAADEWVYRYRGNVVEAPVKIQRLPNDPDTPVIIPAHVKVQRIPHRPGRFEVSVPKGRGQISADWMLQRQGVDVRAEVART